MQIKGKTALVTGASRGEGLALTAELLRRRCRVAAGARNPAGAAQLQRLKEEGVGQGSGQLEIVQLDVSGGAAVAAAARDLRRRFEHFDVSWLASYK